MKCPCKDCLTLSLCKNLDIHHLVAKCYEISTYLKATTITDEVVLETQSEKTIKRRLFSKLKPFMHRIRLNKIKEFIPHSYTIE